MKLLKATLVLGSLGIGVVLGAIATALLLSWTTRVPVSATPSTVKMTGRMTVEIGTDARKGILLKRDFESFAISPPRSVVWTKMVPAKSANSVFLLAQHEIGDDMYNWTSLYRVALAEANQSLSSNKVTQVLSYAAVTNMVGDAVIEELDGASEDGRRLLLTLAFREPANEQWATYIRRRPYYLYLDGESRTLTEIVP